MRENYKEKRDNRVLVLSLQVASKLLLFSTYWQKAKSFGSLIGAGAKLIAPIKRLHLEQLESSSDFMWLSPIPAMFHLQRPNRHVKWNCAKNNHPESLQFPQEPSAASVILF